MFTSVQNLVSRHRRFRAAEGRGQIAVEVNSTAAAFIVWMVALVIVQVAS